MGLAAQVDRENRAYEKGKAAGAAAERSRVRRDLLEFAATLDGYFDEETGRHVLLVAEPDLRAALNEICPGED